MESGRFLAVCRFPVNRLQPRIGSIDSIGYLHQSFLNVSGFLVGGRAHRLTRDGPISSPKCGPEFCPCQVAHGLLSVGVTTVPITRTIMRPDHTVTEFASPQPLLGSSVEDGGEAVPRSRTSVLSRATFCFAWLFGLEAFLNSSADEMPPCRLDRH